MEMSPNIGALTEALAAAQAELDGSFVATHTAKIPGKEGKSGYEYKYGDLSDALRATRALNRNGIAVVQPTSTTERGVKVITQLSHKSGEWMRSEPLIMPVGVNNAQAVGSAITYARRYQLLGMVGLAPEDDDGQEARDNPPQEPKQPRVRKPKNSEPAAPSDDSDEPLCRGPAAGIAKANDERAKRLAALLKKPLGPVWVDALREAGVPEDAYPDEAPFPTDLRVSHGKAVKAVLDAKLAALEAEPPAPAPKPIEECRRLWGLLMKAAPDDFKNNNWRIEWAQFAGLTEWPESPSAEQCNAAADGMRLALERIQAP